jgi:hypothetical protein
MKTTSLFLLTMFVPWFSTSVFADDVQRVIAKVKASENEIHDIECHLVESWPDRKAHEVMRDVEWWYKDAKQGFAGDEYLISASSGTLYHNYFASRFNGEVVKNYRTSESKSYLGGQIEHFKYGEFKQALFGVESLLGYDIRWAGFQTMGEVLSLSKSCSLRPSMEVVDGHKCIVIDASEVEHSQEVPEAYSDATLWLDPERSYRVLKLERFYVPPPQNGQPKYLNYRMDNVQLVDFDGIWFPVYGERSYFSVEPVFPDGKSSSELSNLPAAEVDKLVKWKTGILTQRVTTKIDVSSLKINKGIDDSRFEFEFPVGTAVWDDLKQIGYVVGKETPLDDPNHPTRVLPPGQGVDVPGGVGETTDSSSGKLPTASLRNSGVGIVIYKPMLWAITAIIVALILVTYVIIKASRPRKSE